VAGGEQTVEERLYAILFADIRTVVATHGERD
jgi:hypothetical protein